MTGWIGLGGDVAGIVLTVLSSTYRRQPYTDGSGKVVYPDDNTIADILTITGAIVMGASRVYQMIRPYFYAQSYNKELRKAIFTENRSLSVVPYTKTGDDMGMAMVGTVKF